mmetsp:Transcript_71912/g.150246  ORF Transcript_71912/g.150246 Transcript_71912/m.150246 type:complete len:397 (+) Transcript_71912:75-1265(+)
MSVFCTYGTLPQRISPRLLHVRTSRLPIAMRCASSGTSIFQPGSSDSLSAQTPHDLHTDSLKALAAPPRSPSSSSSTLRLQQFLAPAIGAGLCLTGLLSSQGLYCETGKPEDDDDDDDDDDEFRFDFAKPPVQSADIGFRISTRLVPGDGGKRPTAQVTTSSTFSLPVERGWPRDILTTQDVASNMRDIIADRFPRYAAEHWGLELRGAPPQLRGLAGGWPKASDSESKAATLVAVAFPLSLLPPLLTLKLLDEGKGEVSPQKQSANNDDQQNKPKPKTGDDEDVEATDTEAKAMRNAVCFKLGGLLCAGSEEVLLKVSCDETEIKKIDGEERLDIRLKMSLSQLPVAGRGWAFVGCGGCWWWERYRLPPLRSLFESFHQMIHDQMMLFYIAGLRS